MKAIEESIRYEVIHNGSFIPVHLEQIEQGDIIRMFRPDGKPIMAMNVSSEKLSAFAYMGYDIDIPLCQVWTQLDRDGVVRMFPLCEQFEI